MSGLFGGGGMSTSDTPLTGMTIQSSSNGKPIPIVYGTTRVTPNLLWYGDFTPIEHTTSQGGKGGGSSSTTHTYTASLILGLCEGPVAGIPNAFIDKSVVDPSTLFSLFLGTYPQSPWSYLTSSHADQAIGYQGITYAAAASYDLGNSSNLPNHSFEVSGKLILSGTSDADPSQVVSDLLTSQIYGVPNAPPISGLTQYSNYCRAAGILISPCYDTQTAAAQMITDLAQITNTGIYVSEGVLKLVPYGDAALTLNGATYTPVLTVIANLGDDDFLGNSGADPVIVKRNAIAATVSTTADAYNQVTVEYLDRANSYNVSTVVVQDQAAIDVYGLRPMPNITAHQIATAATANVVAMLILQRAVYVRSQYSFRLGWQWCYLEPTDLVTLTDSALGLNLYPVRILSVEEDEFGTLTVLAEDAPPGVSSHVVANVPINGGYNVNQAIVPGDTNTPAIFEAPNALTAPDLQLWIAASGGTQWGGCEVWASSDGSTYRQIGTITSPARHGVLTASIVAGTDPDTTHALAVDLTASRGQLLAGTDADADVGNTMLWVDGELISYSAATLTSAYHYSLGNYLRRGQKGTANATHANGAQFARLDDVIFKYTVPIDRIGSPIYLKFPAFNVWGESKQSLASVAAYTHTFAGNKPNPLTGLTAVGGMFEITLNWTFTASQIDRDFIEVWGATTNNRASAYLLSSVKNPAQAWAHPGLTPGQTWYYWARVVDTSGNDSDFYPLSATAGITAAPSTNPSALLTQLNAAIGATELMAGLNDRINLIDGNTAQPALPYSLAQLAAIQTGLNRKVQVNLDASAAGLLRDVISTNTSLAVISDAGIYTDAATGTVKIYAVEANNSHLTTVDARLDAHDGSIALKASTTYVDGAIAAATLGTADLALFEGMDTRVTTAEVNISSLNAAVSLKASDVALTATTARVTTAETNISALTGTVATKVSSTDFTSVTGGIDARLGSAETTLSSLGDTSSITSMVQQANKAYRDANTDAQTLLRSILNNEADANLAAQTLALARNDLTAYTDANVSAEAAQRLFLAAVVDGHAAQISDERIARATADAAEASARLALGVVVAGNTAAIVSEQTARADAISAEASARTALEARVTNTEGNVSANVAAFLEEQIVRTDQHAATVSDISTLTAAVAANGASITAEQTARSDADAAEASARTALAARVTTAESGITTNAASIVTEQSARAAADVAEASARTTLAARVTTTEGDIATNSASIVSEASTRATQTSALATRATNLEASVNSGSTGLATKASVSYVDTAKADAISSAASTTALVQAQLNSGGTTFANIATAQSTANAAVTASSSNASALSTVQARLDTGDYAAVKTESSANASALGTLNVKYSVKVDANNHVTGFELNSDGTVGSFVILSDKFLICKPDGTGTPKAVLSLGTVNGTTALGLDGSLIIDGSISARSINAEGLTVSNGLAPAVGPSGTGTMTGYGAVFNSNGTFAIGTPVNNIVYDMTGGITINGQLIANANIVSKSATEFLSTFQWIPNGSWATYTFTMEHAGNASILLTYGFQTSNILGTFEVRAQIDGYTSYDYYTGGDDGTVTIPTFYSGLAAGTHTLYMYALQQYATGNHLVRFTLLRSYR